MVTLRAFIIFGLLLTAWTLANAQEKAVSSAPSASRPEFPLMVRIDDKALDPLRAKDVRQQGHVDRIVLGTRAVGTSETRGAMNVNIIPDRDDAAFIIRFHGETRTRTTGSNGPAIIRSRTATEFDCARLVVFEPRIGLVAGKSTSAARTSLVFDGFDTDRRLGRRLEDRAEERGAASRRVDLREPDAQDADRGRAARARLARRPALAHERGHGDQRGEARGEEVVGATTWVIRPGSPPRS